MVHFATTASPDYALKVEFTDSVFKSLFDLRLHFRSTTADALALQEPLGKPPLPLVWFLKRTVILDGDYMIEITPNRAAVCASPFN